MKLLFNDHTLRTVNRVALPIVIAMSLSTVLLPMLKATSSEHSQLDVVPFYDLYRLGSLFGLQVDTNSSSMKKVMREVLTPVPHHLNAIYIDRSRSFVAIDDGTSTTFVDYGMLYKNVYRLVSISPNSAIFSAYGKRMTLHLGEEGTLGLKETVTAYVPDETAVASNHFSIPRSTIDRYTKNMGETLKNISITPVIEQGSTTGFRVNSLADGTLFALLGLQKGDIITDIDNKPINSHASAFTAYQAGLRRSAIKITVLRNNQPKDLEYEISR